jgi:hypothetical protein
MWGFRLIETARAAFNVTNEGGVAVGATAHVCEADNRDGEWMALRRRVFAAGGDATLRLRRRRRRGGAKALDALISLTEKGSLVSEIER